MADAKAQVPFEEVKVESKHLTELTEQKNELLGKVQTLKKELQVRSQGYTVSLPFTGAGRRVSLLAP